MPKTKNNLLTTVGFRRSHRARFMSLSLSGLLLTPAWPFAAEAPITPGSVQSTIDDGKPRVPTTPAQMIFPVQTAPSLHDPRAKRFQVNAFDMSGNTIFKKRALKRVLERFVDQELNLYDLNKAADAITNFYHQRGYLLARAVIPAQKVSKGVVIIRIVEGRIGKVSFSGNQRHSSHFLEARTGALKPGALVETKKLENTLLLLNDIPGLSAKVVLEPGEEFGDTDANINLTEKLFSGSVNLNNYGRYETGRNKLELALNLNSPFGWGDQLALSGSSTQHKLVRYWKAGYSLPLNTIGTRVAISSAKTEYEVSGALAALGIHGEVRSSDVTVSHPLQRSRNESQWLTVAAKRSRLTQTALDTPISDNTIKVLTTTYLLNRIQDDSSVTNVSLGLTTNFKKVKSVDQQDAVFARMELDVNYTTPFVKQWDMYLRGDMVHSNSMLPDTEKFSLGGPGSVRAFRPSEVRGDSGYVATVELRHPFAVANRIGTFRVSADAGQVIYKMPGYSDSRDRLRSVGVGATFYPFSGAALSIDAARSVGKDLTKNDGKTNRIWMNFSASF